MATATKAKSPSNAKKEPREKSWSEKADDGAKAAEKKKQEAVAKAEQEKAERKPALRDVFSIAVEALENNEGPFHSKQFCLPKDEGGLELMDEREQDRLYLRLVAESRKDDGVVVKVGTRATFDLRALNPEGLPYRPGSKKEQEFKAEQEKAAADKKAKEEDKAAKAKAKEEEAAAKAEAKSKKDAEAAAKKDSKEESKASGKTTTPVKQREEALAGKKDDGTLVGRARAAVERADAKKATGRSAKPRGGSKGTVVA